MKEMDLMDTMQMQMPNQNTLFRFSKKNKKMKNQIKNFKKELQLQHKKNSAIFTSGMEKKEVEKKLKVNKTEHMQSMYMEQMPYMDQTKHTMTKKHTFTEEIKGIDKNRMKKELSQNQYVKQDVVKEDVLKTLEQLLKVKQDTHQKLNVSEKEGVTIVEIDFQKKKEMHWKINEKGEKTEIIESRKTFHPIVEKQEMEESEKNLKEKGKEFFTTLEGFEADSKMKKFISSDIKQHAIKEIKETFEIELKQTNRLQFSFEHNEFGKIETQIQKENDYVKVVMKVVNDDQKEKIEQMMQELQQELQEQDIQIQIDVKQQEEKEKQQEQQETFIKPQNSENGEEKNGEEFENILQEMEEE